MKRNCFRKEKEYDFIRAYEEELKELGDIAPYLTRQTIIMRTMYSGKARYYISFDEAARNIRKVMEHIPINCKNECKKAMYEEMTRKVCEYMSRKPSISYRQALYTLLSEGRASRFFFGLQTARLILYRNQRREFYCK